MRLTKSFCAIFGSRVSNKLAGMGMVDTEVSLPWRLGFLPNMDHLDRSSSTLRKELHDETYSRGRLPL